MVKLHRLDRDRRGLDEAEALKPTGHAPAEARRRMVAAGYFVSRWKARRATENSRPQPLRDRSVCGHIASLQEREAGPNRDGLVHTRRFRLPLRTASSPCQRQEADAICGRDLTADVTAQGFKTEIAKVFVEIEEAR